MKNLLLLRFLIVIFVTCPSYGMVCYMCETLAKDKVRDAENVPISPKGNGEVRMSGSCERDKTKWLEDECEEKTDRACYKLSGQVYQQLDDKIGVFNITQRGCFNAKNPSGAILKLGKVGECVRITSGAGEGQYIAVAELCVCDDERMSCNTGTTIVVNFFFMVLMILVLICVNF